SFAEKAGHLMFFSPARSFFAGCLVSRGDYKNSIFSVAKIKASFVWKGPWRFSYSFISPWISTMATMENKFISSIPDGVSDVPPEPRRTFQVVVAATLAMGIGKDGKLPWKLPSDLKFFKEITTHTSVPAKKNAIIMGRKTWESIPNKHQPLPGRLNVVLSRSGSFDIATMENVVMCGSLGSALEMLAAPPYSLSIETVFVIGGGQVFREALNEPNCDAIHITAIETPFECDTFMPPVDKSVFRPWLVQDIISNGIDKGDRTGTGTLSKFGCQMRFNLRKCFPLLTTKRVFWRGVVEELLWFISGSTNAKVLQEKGIHIWDGNASKDYLDSIGLKEREEGDLGPVYGFQWRHFGARYTDMHADYTGQGFDQLADVIHKIKYNPEDRRIILSAWNPADLKLMALPPCHMFAQFYVANGELSCQMYQRSCDMGLGVPFNIASYGLLTCIIAHVCDLVPGDFIHVLGDAHVYKNHVGPLMEQLQNSPRPFPVLKINPEKKDIDSFVASDFQLLGYDSHKKIDMKMAV
ncbi:hypothetical protein KI387_021929, partial [Taxus chinensis]